MPNNVANRIYFYGDQDKIEQIFDAIKGDKLDFYIDFEKIIPMPDNIYRGPLGSEEYGKYGNNNWYDWSIENWGTKWNAYRQERNGNELYFETAWNMPFLIYKKLAQICSKNGVIFEGSWSNEDWGYDSGIFSNDLSGNFYFNEDETLEDNRKRCIECWGFDPVDEE